MWALICSNEAFKLWKIKYNIGIATQMRSSIIEYSPTTITPTLNVHFIASWAAAATRVSI